MNPKPFGDRILIRPIKEKEKGGLIIPETAKEKPSEGIVLEVGDGLEEDGKLLPMNIKVGQQVLYGLYAGTDVKVDGEDLKIIHQDDVIGIMEDGSV